MRLIRIHEVNPNGDPRRKGGVRFLDDCFNAGDEAFVGGVDEAVDDASERERKGRFPCSSND